jgi:hypothetical protein
MKKHKIVQAAAGLLWASAMLVGPAQGASATGHPTGARSSDSRCFRCNDGSDQASRGRFGGREEQPRNCFRRYDAECRRATDDRQGQPQRFGSSQERPGDRREQHDDDDEFILY